MPRYPDKPELLALALEGIRYGLHIAGVDVPFQPAMITESPAGERTITQVLLVKSDDVLSDARKLLNSVVDVHRAVLVFDGNLHLSGETVDAVIVQVCERDGQAHEFAQRYVRKRFGKKIAAVGNPGYVAERPSLFG